MMIRRMSVATAVLFFTLACGGGVPSDGGATPAPSPTPAPAPAPEPTACDSWHGVKLPIDDGTVEQCDDNAVTVAHAGEKGGKARWRYNDAFKGSGWQQAEPKGRLIIVNKGTETVTFGADGEKVKLKYTNSGP